MTNCDPSRLNCSVSLAPVLGTHAEAGATLLGAQLAMPYYSFGTQLARASKE